MIYDDHCSFRLLPPCQGGGGLVQQLRRSYSLTDLTERDWAQDRFTDVTEEIEEGERVCLYGVLV